MFADNGYLIVCESGDKLPYRCVYIYALLMIQHQVIHYLCIKCSYRNYSTTHKDLTPMIWVYELYKHTRATRMIVNLKKIKNQGDKKYSI